MARTINTRRRGVRYIARSFRSNVAEFRALLCTVRVVVGFVLRLKSK